MPGPRPVVGANRHLDLARIGWTKRAVRTHRHIRRSEATAPGQYEHPKDTRRRTLLQNVGLRACDPIIGDLVLGFALLALDITWPLLHGLRRELPGRTIFSQRPFDTCTPLRNRKTPLRPEPIRTRTALPFEGISKRELNSCPPHSPALTYQRSNRSRSAPVPPSGRRSRCPSSAA